MTRYRYNLCSCGAEKYHTSAKCQTCRNKSYQEKRANSPISEYLNHSATRAKFNDIRSIARQWMEERGIPKECKICGFDCYVEVCHIHPLSSFPLTATLAEVNSPNNLVYLCPNHHKMLDLGLLDGPMV